MLSNVPGHHRDCLCLSPCWPPVNITLVTDQTISKRASGRNRWLWFLVLPCQVPLRLHGRWWVYFLSHKPLWVCPGLFPHTQQGVAPSRFPEPIFWICQTLRGVSVALQWGGSTSLFFWIVCGLAAYYCQSLMTPESVYVSVSSAMVKMQDGWKEKQNKAEHQDRVKLKYKNKKMLLSGMNTISEVVVRGFQEGGRSGISQGKVIDFLLGGSRSSQARYLLWGWDISGPQKSYRCFPNPLPYASHSRLSFCDSSLQHAPFAGTQDG